MMNLFSRLALLSLLLVLACCTSTERRSALLTSIPAQMAAQHGLVDVRTYLPDVAIDLRYATSQNVANQPLYPPNMPCLLYQSTADRLKRVQKRLRAHGMGLRLWDAWRPPEVQLSLMKKGGHTGMFLDPKVAWSRHCSGVAVDVTLVDTKGREQRLPTYHDENSDEAYYQYSGNDPEIKKNLALLQRTMAAEGFSMIPLEWWHFDDYEHFFNPPKPLWAKDIGLTLPEVK